DEGERVRELARGRGQRRGDAGRAEDGEGRRLLVRLAARERRDERSRVERAVQLREPRAIVALAPPALHRPDERRHRLVDVTEGALERAVALDARVLRRRADAVIARERVPEAHVLARHVTGDAASARAGW